MIWNAWVLALIIGQIAVAAVNGAAFVNALRIVRTWDTASLSPKQLELEHRSELIAAVVSWSLLFQVFSLLVFEITARSLAPFIPGAMCTVGTLHAHYLGWPVLFVKIGALYVYGWWIVINYVDMQLEGFPLTGLKSRLMLFLFPLLLVDLSMQIVFFAGLDPSVISSCCGVIFEVAGEGFGSTVASLPPKFTRALLLAFLLVLLVLSYALRWERRTAGNIAYALGSGAGLFLGTAGIVAFTAPYIYMMPALHCPFIFLDQEHYNYGYLVYIPLFAASFFGMSLGALAMIVRLCPAAETTAKAAGLRFMGLSRALWVMFILAAYAPWVKFWIDTGGSADLFQVGY